MDRTTPEVRAEADDGRTAAASLHVTRLPQDRLAWVDVAKGIGIILVVYGHALRGFWGPKTWPVWTVAQDRLIYAFHMPLFFVIGGLFLWQSIERGKKHFIRSRWWALIYPYLLWSFVCGGIEVAASRFANSPMSLRDLWLIPLIPVEQFWFLYALLIVQLIAAVCFPFRTFLAVLAVSGLSFAVFSGGSTILHVALRFLPFLAVGVCGAQLIKRLPAEGRAVQTLIFALAWVAFAVIYGLGQTGVVDTIALGCLGAIGCIALATLMAKSRIGRGMALLGQASMAIYVLHTLFSAGARAGFVLLGLDRYALWTLIAEFAVGLILPVPLWLWSRAHPKGHLFGFGRGPLRNANKNTVPLETNSALPELS
jgi:fucose 4-O-acetylase-like acetyltransferase